MSSNQFCTAENVRTTIATIKRISQEIPTERMSVCLFHEANIQAPKICTAIKSKSRSETPLLYCYEMWVNTWMPEFCTATKRSSTTGDPSFVLL